MTILNSSVPNKSLYLNVFMMFLANVATDTGEKELEEDNYVPKMKTFEQDILDSMGIKDTRKRGKTYWY